MSSNFRTAREQLSYPLYGADFDPSNPDFLLVGGGGGSTSSGVPNKITLLDVSRLEKLNQITDIDLAKDEDSVTSLAVLESTDTSLTAYAGINSSVKDQAAGKNEHFRSFRIGLPPKKRKADGSEKSLVNAAAGAIKSQSLAKTALFRAANTPKSETYQRVLRVSPAHMNGGERLAALASGLATKNEVLVIRATSSPGLNNVISRVDIESGEAADLDIVPVDNEAKSHVLSYCTDYDVYLQHIPSVTGANIKEPIKAFSSPASARRSRIRCLRWLSSRHILLLCNRPAGGGAELVVLKTDKDYTQAQLVFVKVLTKSTKQAVGLATMALSVSPKGEQQFVVAVAGQDSSIEILSIDLLPGAGMTKFKRFVHLREVHSGPITRITFSYFQPPPIPVTKDTKPQYIRLASVGVDQKAVVQTLPLRPYPAVYTKEPRYVLIPPSESFQNTLNIFTAIVIISAVAFIMQAFCEIRGYVPPTINAQSWLPSKWHEKVAVQYPYAHVPLGSVGGPVIPESLPPALSSVLSATTETASQAADAILDSTTLLSDLVAAQKTNPDMQDQQIVIRDSTACNLDDDGALSEDCDVETELHDTDKVKVHGEKYRKWDQLSEREKKGWKKRLVDAGRWTEKQGETILKGILFSELAGAVGAAVRG